MGMLPAGLGELNSMAAVGGLPAWPLPAGWTLQAVAAGEHSRRLLCCAVLCCAVLWRQVSTAAACGAAEMLLL